VETRIVPWVLDGIELGPNVLEIGPGPGLTTDLLRTQVTSLTCIEIDQRLASSLKQRTAGKNVAVVLGDATAISFANQTF
jgi:16S rRNA A1518/A1519 N6-dimethyltransferase RsmA/KsgA/DIM1 with predicted DNA glycosylase/AP lyase activity